MLTMLVGENSFEIEREIEHATIQFDGAIEHVDGAMLSLENIPDILMGMTLFSEKRLVIIKELSLNKDVWNELPTWLPRVNDDVSVLLVEPKPDKRTKTYKELAGNVRIKNFPLWGERDSRLAEDWVAQEATRHGLIVDKKGVQRLVERVGVNQWGLYWAIEKLSLYQTATPELINEIIDANPSENVFNLLDMALRGKREAVLAMIQTLRTTEDPYMVFGLLSSQVFQLAVLAVSDKSSGEVAKDIGAHPFALQKLATHAKKRDRREMKRIVTIFADADVSLKSTAIDPWLVVERVLVAI